MKDHFIHKMIVVQPPIGKRYKYKLQNNSNGEAMQSAFHPSVEHNIWEQLK